MNRLYDRSTDYEFPEKEKQKLVHHCLYLPVQIKRYK